MDTWRKTSEHLPGSDATVLGYDEERGYVLYHTHDYGNWDYTWCNLHDWQGCAEPDWWCYVPAPPKPAPTTL